MGVTPGERLILQQETDRQLRQQHLARYEFASKFVQGKRVLDIACGTGYGAAKLMAAGATAVRGVDIDPEAIRYAREHHSVPGVEFFVGRAEEIAPDASVDVVVSFETIEHVPDEEKFLASLIGSLVPDGTLVISTPVRERGTLDTPPANPFHIREWNQEEFQLLMGRFFPHVTMFGQYNVPKAGFPGSRTIQRAILRAVAPGAFSPLQGCHVVPEPPSMPLFGVSMIYQIAVCSRT